MTYRMFKYQVGESLHGEGLSRRETKTQRESYPAPSPGTLITREIATQIFRTSGNSLLLLLLLQHKMPHLQRDLNHHNQGQF